MSEHTRHHLDEITTQVAECITRFGVAGEVHVDAERASLTGYGPPAEVAIGDLLERWPELSHEDRARRCLETARKLVAARRSSLPPGRPKRLLQLPGWLAPLIFFALLGGFGWWWLSRPVPKTAVAEAAAPASTSGAVDGEQRAASVCQRTRSRVMRGASVGPLDVEGWVVELALQRPSDRPFERGKLLGDFIDLDQDEPHVVWTQAPALSSLTGIGTRVEVAESSLVASGIEPRRSLVLTFMGSYIKPYFDEKARIQYVMFANALAQRAGASHGALYARCTGDSNHHIGAWFLGPTPGEAVGSLIYFMGTYASSPHVSAYALSDAAAPDRASLLDSILKSTANSSRSEIGLWLGAQGGMLAGPADGPTRITFPFKDANRASRASREIARLLEIGPG
ncbi:MAG: hypothetical protein H6718_15615 [Polyangiaceae bacterium]|nr:hypothetical protein [Myxococcales bacterium]MCB9586827.1 hypothetical protein [Polyangiaceae bacterium]MCB9606334.1 hypothetical protein [Polyangiaceae bacterium]